MGRSLQLIVGDTQTDPVDAVTAWRQIALQNPAFVIGPTSLEMPAVANLFDPARIVDFFVGGDRAYDHLTQKYVWRAGASDSSLVAAQAYYAIQKGYKRCSMLFESGSGAKLEETTLAADYQAHGGTVTDVEFILGAQTSYRPELLKLYASKPDCVFFLSDTQTIGTLVSNIKELGLDNTPMVGDDYAATPDVVKAAGYAFASKWITGVGSSVNTGPAYTQFQADFTKAYPAGTQQYWSDNVYDMVIIAALAMSEAHSTDPTVWVNHITKVTNPPAGTAVYTYQGGIAALNAGDKITYSGAAGFSAYDQYHNLFGSWDIVQADASGTEHTLISVTAAEIAQYAT